MIARVSLRIAESLVPLALALIIFFAWREDRRDRAQLATQLATAQQSIADAASRQKDRDTLLNQTLAQLAAQKHAAVTPEQILRALPQALFLPVPITARSANSAREPNVGARLSASPSDARATDSVSRGAADAQAGSGLPANLPYNPIPNAAAPSDAILPAADLKPLYDFALDCKACQAKLAAAQSDLSDEKAKTAALTKERDAAMRAAKGGSVLRRIERAAKWFVVGAVAGAVAAKAAH
jgi:hypothetical protein